MSLIPLTRSPGLRLAVLGLGPLLVFVAVRTGSRSLILTATIGGFAGFLALLAPRLASAAVCGLIAMIPIYWAPGTVGPLTLVPALGGCAILAGPAVAGLRRRDFHLVPLDVAVAAMLAFISLAALLNAPAGPSAVVQLAASTVAPYATFRVLATDSRHRTSIAAGLALAATALALFAIVERTSGNPFFAGATGGRIAAVWARPELRFGEIRSETSFGHPIAFGMFLALASTLAFGLVLARRGRVIWLVCGAVAAGALGTTLTRGPLIVAAVGIVLCTAAALRTRVSVTRLSFVVVMLTAGWFVALNSGRLELLLERSLESSPEARTVTFRLGLIQLLADRSSFSLFGHQASAEEGGVLGSALARAGLRSLDNEFTLIYLTSGLLALAAFLAVGAMLWREALRRTGISTDVAWTASAASATLGLLSVALLTQYATLYWIAVAVTAAISQDRRAAADRSLSIDAECREHPLAGTGRPRGVHGGVATRSRS